MMRPSAYRLKAMVAIALACLQGVALANNPTATGGTPPASPTTSNAALTVNTIVAPAASSVGADPIMACVEAHRVGRQALERQTLIDARTELGVCAANGCPIAIRSECREWLTHAERQVPTLVFSAASERGDVSLARVFVDGQLVAERLDGQPLEAHPGARLVRFELPDGRTRELSVVVGVGEKDRIVRVDFTPPPSSDEPRLAERIRTVPPPTPHSPGYFDSRQRRIGAMLGLAALGGGIAAGTLLYVGLDRRNATRDRCAPFCSDEEVSRVRRWFILADVVGVAAAVTGGAGLYLYFSGGRSRGGPTGGSMAGVDWRGEF